MDHFLVNTDAERRSLSPVELRQKAAAFALEAVESQKEQFRRCACKCVSLCVIRLFCVYRSQKSSLGGVHALVLCVFEFVHVCVCTSVISVCFYVSIVCMNVCKCA
jgi:predicted exporter